MRRTRLAVTLGLLVAAVLAINVAVAGFGSATTDHRDLLLNRVRSEFATGDFAGDHVTFYGSGTWSMTENTIDARGVLIHQMSDGKLVARAIWKAVGVESFTSYGTITGTPLEGGVLVLDVRFFPPEGEPFTVNDFTVTCLVGTPPAGVEEGVTIPSLGLTEPVDEEHRFTLFFQI